MSRYFVDSRIFIARSASKLSAAQGKEGGGQPEQRKREWVSPSYQDAKRKRQAGGVLSQDSPPANQGEAWRVPSPFNQRHYTKKGLCHVDPSDKTASDCGDVRFVGGGGHPRHSRRVVRAAVHGLRLQEARLAGWPG